MVGAVALNWTAAIVRDVTWFVRAEGPKTHRREQLCLHRADNRRLLVRSEKWERQADREDLVRPQLRIRSRRSNDVVEELPLLVPERLGKRTPCDRGILLVVGGGFPL